MINFTDLTRLTRSALAMAEENLAKMRKELATTGDWNVAHSLKWGVEKWMAASSNCRVWMDVALRLEYVLDNNDPNDDATLDAEAATIAQVFASESMRAILRGVNTSNTTTLLEEQAMISAHKMRMEYLGFSEFQVASVNSLKMIDEAREAEKAKAEEKKRHTPHHATYAKHGGKYAMFVKNSAEVVLEFVELESTTQQKAIEEMHLWLDARELSHIRVSKAA